jgi:hypothetical protein
MKTNTDYAVENIRARGYWRKGTTLLGGGWQEVYKFAGEWRTYQLFDNDESPTHPIDEITAKDDEAAVKAFGELYRLDEFSYEIMEKKTEYRTVAQS